MPALDLRLYVVTDRELARPRSLVEVIGAAIDGGATIVQLRDKQATTRALVETARALTEVCTPRGVALVVNDRVDVAMAAPADGVHLGQSDMDAADARRLLGPRAIIGVSVRSMADVHQAERSSASYLAANGVWTTTTKTDFGSPLGPEALGELARATHLPMVAIGGIDTTNAASVASTGCAGIAVVSAVMRAPDPAKACRALRRAFDGD